jgi:hypothetical protein
MSQTKSQLLSPVGILTASGINVSGVITATSFSGDGSGLTGVNPNQFLSIGSRVGIVTVNVSSGIFTVFGRSSNTNVPI